ncbi:MAG: hypothetical protein TR69_WS6001000271 [candidate division WS6 bacterium OLB20]|uniref:Uncharacterized protein n=1 Tax=candidate division WS6 bacterium OLB20 TaxID=1617426 RepID=A0A136M0H2_9BACT|nr:MAG: hypothetical protein TR69_WS6001000271 [candidate division WS6 bacterium OLB20]
MTTFTAAVEKLRPYLIKYESDTELISRRKSAAYWTAMFILGLLLGLLLYFPASTGPDHSGGPVVSSDDVEFDSKESKRSRRSTSPTPTAEVTPTGVDGGTESNSDRRGNRDPGGSGNQNTNPGPTQAPVTSQPTPTPAATAVPTQPQTSPAPSPTPTSVPAGWRILGLKPWLMATAGVIAQTTDTSVMGQTGTVQTILRMDDGLLPIATFNVEFVSDLYWTDLTAGSIGNKAFFHYPGGIEEVPGAVDASYHLYVFKGVSNKVGVCPGAASLEAVNKDCSGVFYLNESSPNVDIISYQGREYWKIGGLRGTGAFSLLDTKDILTRLQVGTASDHYIQFTTTYDLDSSGDTIVVDFVPGQLTTDGTMDFDFNGIDSEDIDVVDDGGDLTLCTGGNPCSPAAGVWGVEINATADTITFTAPTDAGPGEIQAGSIMVIRIGENAVTGASGDTQIINPDNVGLYEISVRMDNGSDEDFGELEIPVIDDDTTNVVGYIDTFISFDLDTATADTDCDAAGGASPCNSHGGSTDGSGYVIDLGELNTSSVNDSGDSVYHADGLTGAINSIWFDLSTNAESGAVVTMFSLNEALAGPGSNEIPSVGAGEVQITSGSGLYGINSFAGLTNTAQAGAGVISDDCDGDGGDDYYCSVADGGNAITIFTTGGDPVDQLRIQWEVGASPDSSDATGTYSDELTFIATATF